MADDTVADIKRQSMTIIVTKGSLDWAYPPFILATTAAAMDYDVTLFFTFYGLALVKKKLDPKFTVLGNAAMEMPMFGTHIAMPNFLPMIPGVDAMAGAMMKSLIKKNNVASLEDLREAAVLSDVRMIACNMTVELFDYKREDLMDEIELGGAASYFEVAAKSHINMFI